MDDFESFVKRGAARKAFPDIQRARKLVKDGKSRMADVELLDIEKMPKLIFENIYDAIRDFLLAVLLSDGYKTISYEAPISYLLKKNWDVYSAQKIDMFRYLRNGSKYYGEEISIEQAKDIKAFYIQIKEKINKLIKENKLE